MDVIAELCVKDTAIGSHSLCVSASLAVFLEEVSRAPWRLSSMVLEERFAQVDSSY